MKNSQTSSPSAPICALPRSWRGERAPKAQPGLGPSCSRCWAANRSLPLLPQKSCSSQRTNTAGGAEEEVAGPGTLLAKADSPAASVVLLQDTHQGHQPSNQHKEILLGLSAYLSSPFQLPSCSWGSTLLVHHQRQAVGISTGWGGRQWLLQTHNKQGISQCAPPLR